MNTAVLQPQATTGTYVLNPSVWVDMYFDYLYAYTIKRVKCHEQAKDLVQDTFVAGLGSAPNFKGNATERTWLVAILKRKIVDHYRKINSKKGGAEVRINHWRGQEEGVSWFEQFVPDPKSISEFDFIENQELGLLIENCIAQLPKRYAQAFTLRMIKGYNTDVICEIMEINQSNLWVILHRSRKILQERIENHWFNYKKCG